MSVSYSKDMRDQAKAQGKGLISIAWESPEGYSSTMQSPAGAEMLENVKKALDSAWEANIQESLPDVPVKG